MSSERKWGGYLGGLAMVAICVVPFILVEPARVNSMSLFAFGGPNGGLRWDYGFLLCCLPSVFAAGLVAPLVGYSRWIAIAFTVPIANLYFAWIIGRRVVALSGSPLAEAESPTPPRTHSKR